MLCPRRKGRRLDEEGQQRAIPSVTTTPEKTMPHVIVKLWPGKSEQQKTRLAEEIAKDVMDILHYGEESVSGAFEEINARDWAEQVYKPDTQENRAGLHMKAGYTM